MTGCTHRKVTTYVFVDGNEPAGLWACADCGQKFAPVNLPMEKDAERYCWLRDRGAVGGMRGIFSLMPSEWDEAIDAAMDSTPAVGAA